MSKFFTNNYKETKTQSKLQFLKNKEMSNINANKNNIPKTYDSLLKLKNREHALKFARDLLEFKIKNKTEYCNKNKISRNTLNIGLTDLGIEKCKKAHKSVSHVRTEQLRTNENNFEQKKSHTKQKNTKSKKQNQSSIGGNINDNVNLEEYINDTTINYDNF